MASVNALHCNGQMEILLFNTRWVLVHFARFFVCCFMVTR